MTSSDLIAVISAVMDAAYDWISGCADTVSENPLLLFLVLLPLTDYGIRIFRKMIKASGG